MQRLDLELGSFAPEMDPAARKWLKEYKKLFDQVAAANAGMNAAENVGADKNVLHVLGKVVDDNGTTATKVPDRVIKKIGKIVDENSEIDVKDDKTTENSQKTPLTNMKQENMKVSGIRYALKIGNSLSENVDSVLSMSDTDAKKNKTEGNFVSIMPDTPDVILKNVSDAENLEIIMRFDSFYLATRKSGVLDGHYHNYGDIMKKLPEIISDPLSIMRMNNGRLNVLSSVETSKGKYSIISVELNTIKDINSKNEKYNMVISVIPSNDNYIKNNIEKHAVKVEYEKEDLAQVNHQLYEWLATVNDKSSSKSSISQNSQNSNTSGEISSKGFNSGERSALADGKKVTSTDVARVKGEISEMNIDPRGIMAVANSYFDRYSGHLTRTGLRFEFRKKHFGKLKIGNNGSSVDSVYGELQGLYGLSLFPDQNTVQELTIVLAFY